MCTAKLEQGKGAAPRSAHDDTARGVQKTVRDAVRIRTVVRARRPVRRLLSRTPRLRRAAAARLRGPRRARLAPLLRARAAADAAADRARGRGGRANARNIKGARRRRRRAVRLAEEPVDLARARRRAHVVFGEGSTLVTRADRKRGRIQRAFVRRRRAREGRLSTRRHVRFGIAVIASVATGARRGVRGW